MNRKERIAAYISSKEYISLKFDELMTVLDVPEQDINEFRAILDKLCEEKEIYITRKDRYMPVNSQKDTLTGKLSCNAKGFFGFVINEDGDDVFVSGENMNGALHGDKVIVRFEKDYKYGRREGKIIKIIERSNSVIVGVIKADDDRGYYVLPDNRRIYKMICVPESKMHEAKVGDRVAVEIEIYGNDGIVYGYVLSVLGSKKSLKGCIDGILIEHEVKQSFEDDVILETESVSDSIIFDGNRLDLRDKLIFTIDGDDAKDFDDAVSLEKLENGNYSLGVHIADVSEYVKEGTALDREAFYRGTSIYLPDRVIPMLPEKLSNGICSLNPGLDRLTLSVIMEINMQGEVISHSIEKSIINSKARMTYHNVTKIINGDEELSQKYSNIVETIKLMKELSDILEQMRRRRGAIDFDFPEAKIIVDDSGKPIDIVYEENGISNKIIEQFMLTANETIAEYAYWSEIPFVYRTHQPPSEDKILAFCSFIKHFGLSLKGKVDKNNPIYPKALQSILEKVKDTPEERMVSSTMLRSLMKAEYTSVNLGHFGLSAKYYCHFTSPIRRYPDLIVHRILKKFISGELDDISRQKFEQVAYEAAKNSTSAEMNAEYTERDVEELMKTAYMRAFVGQIFNAVISNITGFGIFIELPNSVQGLIRLENMNEDYFEYDENTVSLRGKRKGFVYNIGDKVEVVLMRADIIQRQIDFVLSSDANATMFSKFESRPEPTRAEIDRKTRMKKHRNFGMRRRKKKKHER